MATYHRVILKLSGEALGVDGHGFCHEKFEEAARMLIDVQKTGVELAVVIGGGNMWRGRRGAAMRMGTVAADQMGMLGTLQNCLYMRDTLEHLGVSPNGECASILHNRREKVSHPPEAVQLQLLVQQDSQQRGQCRHQKGHHDRIPEGASHRRHGQLILKSADIVLQPDKLISRADAVPVRQ